MKKSQRSEVLRYMKQHRCITANTAHDLFGVNRIGTVISDLRDQGYLIETVMVDGTNKYGNSCRYGKYYYKGVAEE